MKCKVCSSKLKLDPKYSVRNSPTYSCRNCKPIKFSGENYSPNYVLYADAKIVLEEFFFVINNKAVHVMNYYTDGTNSTHVEFDYKSKRYYFPMIRKYSEILRKAKRLV